MNASDVLNRLTKHKRSQGELQKFLDSAEPRVAGKLEGCGTWLHLREWIQSGESRLRRANFCKEFLLCRSCAARRAGRMVQSYAGKVASVQEAHPKLIPAMVTLTVKNGKNLEERLTHLKRSWSNMIAARRKAMGSCRHREVEWNKVLGSVRSVEITNKGNGWHPHAHVFVLLEDYLDHKSLSAEWERFTGDSHVVGVTKCKGGVVPGLIETLKYSSKLTELDHAQALEVWRVAKGSRFIDSQGCLRGVPEPDIDSDSDDGLTGPYRDFVACWLFGHQRYTVVQSDKVLVVNRPEKKVA